MNPCFDYLWGGNGYTALMWTCINGRFETTSLLLENGAHFSITNKVTAFCRDIFSLMSKAGKTAQDIARDHSKENCVNLIEMFKVRVRSLCLSTLLTKQKNKELTVNPLKTMAEELLALNHVVRLSPSPILVTLRLILIQRDEVCSMNMNSGEEETKQTMINLAPEELLTLNSLVCQYLRPFADPFLREQSFS
jgi:hypothetical protein